MDTLTVLILCEKYALSVMGLALTVLAVRLYRDGFNRLSALFMGAGGISAFLWKFVLLVYGEHTLSQALSESFEIGFAGFMAAGILAHISSIYTVYAVQQERLVQELRDALANVTKLSGLLPICAWCGKTRDDKGYWNELQAYIEKHSDARFTHGICPDCVKKVQDE